VLTTTEGRPAGERVIVRGRHRGEAYETVGKGDCTRRYVRLDSGNSGHYLLTDLEPEAAKTWPPALETK
jgi:hypothetical protein